MSRVAYVDGQYLPHHSAAVHIEDRSCQFADGVYEVIAVVDGPFSTRGPIIAVITIPDIRWQRCDIKSVALLPNVLGKQRAKEAGAFEAWQVNREGRVSEGTSTNAWIVTSDATVVTRQADSAILNGVTYLAVPDIIRRDGYGFVERPSSVAEAKTAREAFLTSTVVDLLPVVRIDDDPVGNGQPGPLSRKLCANAIWRMRRLRN
jgi:branched-subunit amino acid aminotransferase/4-amino-4-deoxychorismate lyase